MKFVKGQARLPNAGRKKGVPNKRKFQKVADVLAEQGIDLVSDILKDLVSGDMKDADRVRFKFELLSYCEAKPKENQDDTGEHEADLLDDMSDEQLLKLVKSTEGA